MSSQNQNREIEIHGIRKILPHRYPFALVDRVLDYTVGESIEAIKNVSASDPCFQGHYPEYPVFPGVLIIEALSQTCAIHASLGLDEETKKNILPLFVGIEKARFRQQVQPGDQLHLHASEISCRRRLWKYATSAKVNGSVVANAEIIFTYRDI